MDYFVVSTEFMYLIVVCAIISLLGILVICMIDVGSGIQRIAKASEDTDGDLKNKK